MKKIVWIERNEVDEQFAIDAAEVTYYLAQGSRLDIVFKGNSTMTTINFPSAKAAHGCADLIRGAMLSTTDAR